MISTSNVSARLLSSALFLSHTKSHATSSAIAIAKASPSHLPKKTGLFESIVAAEGIGMRQREIGHSLAQWKQQIEQLSCGRPSCFRQPKGMRPLFAASLNSDHQLIAREANFGQ
jgi:hypothetical protein